MKLKALIFDVDGTMANTEQYGHLAASNETFATLGYPIRWSWAEFQRMQHIPGNALRAGKALRQMYPEMTDEALATAVSQFTTLKKKLYIEKFVRQLPLRPGVARLINEALAAGVRLAIVSTSHEVQIHALLQTALADVAHHFEPVLGKETAVKTAPDSPLYKRCLAELGFPPNEVLVIEDSKPGFQAAQIAGLPCAVIYNDYTFGGDFAGAQLVARSLEHFTLEQLAALCLPEFGS